MIRIILLVGIVALGCTFLNAQVPAITSFSPQSGPVGTSVTITGTNFDPAPANNIVYFGATQATVTNATANELTVTVPTGATYQPITVTINGLMGYSSKPFSVTFPSSRIIDASSFAPKVDFSTGPPGTSPSGVVIGDLDGDGKPDITTPNYYGSLLSAFKNTSIAGAITTSSFAAKVDFTTSANSIDLAIGDLNGDGKPDLAVANYGGTTVSVFTNASSTGVITTGSFTPKVDFTAGTNPYSVAIGDVDGDGKPDLAVVNLNSSNVSVYKNTSTTGVITASSFAGSVDFATATNPASVVIGDLDGDGKPEVATANASSTISVFRNTSTPGVIDAVSFAAKIDFTTGTGPFFLAIGDLDADGKQDLVTGNYNANSVSVLKNGSTIGSITFAAKVDFTTGSQPRGVAIGDLDGDGKPEITSANYSSGSVSVFQNTTTTGVITTGSFATKIDFGAGVNPQRVAIGDLDGDGKPELCVTNQSSNTVSVYRNVVTAPIPTISSFTPASGPIGMAVAITGTNFDPTPGNNIVYFGATQATVIAATATQLTVTVPTGATYQPITVTVNGLTAYSSAPFIVTFPGGGVIDVNSFGSKVDFTAGTYPLGVAIGDVDGDSKPDMVGGNYGSSTVSVFRNTSVSGSIISSSFASNVDFTTGPNPWGVAIGDVDGDGKPDLVFANNGGSTVSVFRNTSVSGSITAGSFDSRVDFTTGSSPWGVTIGDLDGDGKPDMVVSNNGGSTVSVFRNTSVSGSITPSSFDSKVDFTTGTSPRGVAIGDLDGDGKLDFIVGTANSGTVSVFRNTSVSGSITVSSFAPMVDFATGSFPQFVAIGDVDGDGKPDMVVSNFSSNNVSVFRNTSVSGSITSSSFDSKVDFLTGTNPTGVAISDVDGDGKPDMVVTNYFNSTVSVFRNTIVSGPITASSFTAKVDFTTGTNPQGVAIGDVDGDGKPDLVVSSSNAGTLSVLRNTILAPEPTAQSPGPIAFSNITIDSFDGTFPIAIPAPDGYLVLMSENIPDFVPVDGVSYNYLDVVGTVGGKNIYVVQNGSFPDFTIDNINPPVILFFKVYSFNGSGPTINYLTSVPPLSGSQAPLDSEPATQASNLIITQPFASMLLLTWFNGSGTSRLVVGRGGGPIDQAPVDGVTYGASSSFSASEDLSGGNYVVYNGSGNSVTVTAIQPGTTYEFFVFEYNGGPGSENYLISTASGNPASYGTDTAAPTITTLSPADNATEVAINSNLVVTFNEAIQKGTGNILIRKISDNSGLSIDVTGSNVTISNATLTIDPVPDMPGSTDIYVNIPNTAIKDLNSNSFTGISDATTWNFSTVDKTPPVVANSTPDKILYGSDLVVSADFTDDQVIGIEYAEIQYRPIAGAAPNNFITAGMNYISGDTFEYIIPANEVTELGVEYKFLITDFAGNDNSSTTQTLYTTRVSHEQQGLRIPYETPGRAVSNYRIIAIPLVLEKKSLNSVLGDELDNYDPTKWTMYRYDGTRFAELTGSTEFEVGKGYWFLTPNSTPLNSGPGTTADVSTNSPFRITLAPGWNQIGNPYNFDISWADVLTANPTLVGNLGKIRVFRGSGVENVNKLQKFEGGFVSNTGSTLTIDIPVAKNGSISGRKGQVEGIKNSLDQAEWEIIFDLKEGNTEYNLGGLGMHPEAALGFDFHDDFNLPRFFEYLEVKFPKERVGMTYTKDIVPASENFVWGFTVESNLKEENISLGWDNSYFGNAKEIYLLDVTSHLITDMRTQDRYNFSHSASKEFKVIYGNSDFVKKELVPNRIVLYEPYPNPFNDQVSIEYALPQESVTMDGEIGIYNGLGVRVSTVSTPHQVGTGKWIWDAAANPSGLYFTRITLGDQVVTKKLLRR